MTRVAVTARSVSGRRLMPSLRAAREAQMRLLADRWIDLDGERLAQLRLYDLASISMRTGHYG